MRGKPHFAAATVAMLAGTIGLSGSVHVGVGTQPAATHHPSTGKAHPAEFLVGFAKENITPSQLPFDYLGGDGYQRVGTSVLNPLWERAIAIAPAGPAGRAKGKPIVIVSVDSQGYFSAYQAGTGGAGVANYGYTQIREAAAKATGIPAGNIVFSSTHSHTAPDTLGVWGGSPTSYFDLVRSQGIEAVKEAISSMQPASIRRGSANGSAYAYNFLAPNALATSNHKVWPVYTKLTVLQALAWKTKKPVVTLVDFGVHPDILEGTTYISPDWPAWMISSVSQAEGGHTMFLQGTLGSEPVLPATNSHPVEYSGISGNPVASAAEAAAYGKAIAGLALRAISHSAALRSGRVAAVTVPIEIPAANGLLLANNVGTLPTAVQSAEGVGHIQRAIVPPYLTGNVVGSVVSVVRVGGGAFFDMPGEIFSDVFSAARKQVGARWFVPVGLADDQLGYVVMPAEWPVAQAAGGATGPAAEYSLGPETGSAIVQGLLRAAGRVGFRVEIRPNDLVASDDPVAAQMEECVQMGFCAANNAP